MELEVGGVGVLNAVGYLTQNRREVGRGKSCFKKNTGFGLGVSLFFFLLVCGKGLEWYAMNACLESFQA